MKDYEVVFFERMSSGGTVGYPFHVQAETAAQALNIGQNALTASEHKDIEVVEFSIKLL